MMGQMGSKGLTFAALGFLALIAGPGVAKADEPSNFAQGSWSLATYGSYTKNFTGEQAKMAGGTVDLGYYVWENVSLNAEFNGFYNQQSGQDSTIADLGILLRQHLFHRGRFSFFVDAGGGVSYADHRTPPTGTYFNFIEQAGIGATFQLRDNIHLIGGVRYFHLSNARIEGPARNPSINATQGYVGLMFSF
jgi:hypothetical protein